MDESSIAGPLMWPADEPWPVCTAVHPKGRGHLLSDVHLRRRITHATRGRDCTAEELLLRRGLTSRLHVPDLRDADPLPLPAVARLHTRDVPDLVGPDGCDLLQVFWCPFEAHGPTAPSRSPSRGGGPRTPAPY
ncbi:hypothetical protein ABZ557_18510 [Streptomyces sp. NPDC019645]|uniref:hypothetical protein n=1 Tax=Streptomyces sp. NPDC019645 TaxID=3154786 RepID=UPI0033CC8718